MAATTKGRIDCVYFVRERETCMRLHNEFLTSARGFNRFEERRRSDPKVSLECQGDAFGTEHIISTLVNAKAYRFAGISIL